METHYDDCLKCERMFSLQDAMERARKETEALMPKMKFDSCLTLAEKKRKVWAALVKKQPASSLVPRSDKEKKAKRKEKNEIYKELKKKNDDKPCVQYIKPKKDPAAGCKPRAVKKRKAKKTKKAKKTEPKKKC
eukprot:jgi/Mesvir1/11326/Mv02076-RA.1